MPAMSAAITTMGTMTAAAMAPPEMLPEWDSEEEPAFCPARAPTDAVEETWEEDAPAPAGDWDLDDWEAVVVLDELLR